MVYTVGASPNEPYKCLYMEYATAKFYWHPPWTAKLLSGPLGMSQDSFFTFAEFIVHCGNGHPLLRSLRLLESEDRRSHKPESYSFPHPPSPAEIRDSEYAKKEFGLWIAMQMENMPSQCASAICPHPHSDSFQKLISRKREHAKCRRSGTMISIEKGLDIDQDIDIQIWNYEARYSSSR